MPHLLLHVLMRPRTPNAGRPRPAHALLVRRDATARWVLLASVLTAIFIVLSPLAVAAQPARDSTSGGLATPAAIKRDASAFARRVGLWASAGLGRGSAGLTCPACQDTQTPALTAQFAVGGRVRERFHVGVALWSWLDVVGDGVDRTARGLEVIARHYPSSDSRWFLTGGLGTSRFAIDDGDARFHASAPALSLGLGWDLPMRGVVLSPMLAITSSTGGPLRSDRTGNAIAEDARLGLWRTTLSITWF
jgi:hypothetical protein